MNVTVGISLHSRVKQAKISDLWWIPSSTADGIGMKNALDQVRPYSRQGVDFIERFSGNDINDGTEQGTVDNQTDAITALVAHKTDVNADMSGSLNILNIDMWAILSAKAEGETEEKLQRCNQGKGRWAYLRTHWWFTGTTDQGRSMRRAAIMMPISCTHKHAISASIERSEGKYRAFRGDDCEIDLPDSRKMNALRMILCGESNSP